MFEGVAAGSPATNQGSGICVVPSQVPKSPDVGQGVFGAVAAGSPATNQEPLQSDAEAGSPATIQTEADVRHEKPKDQYQVFEQMPKPKSVEMLVQNPQQVFEYMPRPTSCVGEVLRGGRNEKH